MSALIHEVLHYVKAKFYFLSCLNAWYALGIVLMFYSYNEGISYRLSDWATILQIDKKSRPVIGSDSGVQFYSGFPNAWTKLANQMRRMTIWLNN